MNNGETLQVWDRQPGEPARWFCRFCRFRDLGPVRRSVLAAYTAEREETTGNDGTPRPRRTPKTWDKASRKFDWRRRAESWDAAERIRFDAEDRDIRDKRRRMVVDAEWNDARSLRAEAQRLIAETAGWSAGKTREIGDELRERATGPEVVKLTVERDLSAVLADAAAMFDKASILSRRAVGLPLTPPACGEDKPPATAAMPRQVDVSDIDRMTDAELEAFIAAKNQSSPISGFEIEDAPISDHKTPSGNGS